MGRKTLVIAAIGTALAAQGVPASAQYMPHLDPNTYILATMNFGQTVDPCMSGTAMKDSKVAEARTGAIATMRGYHAAALAGSGAQASFLPDEDTALESSAGSLGPSRIAGFADPLATAGRTLDAQPVLFYRGGTGATALGQWAVRDADGEVAGVYTGFFKRKRGDWKLHRLSVSQADEMVEPVAQFCRKPGDVTEHRLESAGKWRDAATEAIADAEKKHTKAVSDLAEARQRAAEKPDPRRHAGQIKRYTRLVEKRAKQVEDARENRDKALEELADAQADAAKLKALAGPARGVAGFSVLMEDEDEAGTVASAN